MGGQIDEMFKTRSGEIAGFRKKKVRKVRWRQKIIFKYMERDIN